MKQGIPDEAFEPIEGDDKKLCKEYKKQNRDERRGQKTLFADGGKPWERMGDFAVTLATFDTVDDDSLESVLSKEDRYAELVGSADYLSGRFWADAWCAAFVWKKTKDFDYAITEDVFRRIERNPHDCAVDASGDTAAGTTVPIPPLAFGVSPGDPAFHQRRH